jgi:hypothetical protein
MLSQDLDTCVSARMDGAAEISYTFREHVHAHRRAGLGRGRPDDDVLFVRPVLASEWPVALAKLPPSCEMDHQLSCVTWDRCRSRSRTEMNNRRKLVIALGAGALAVPLGSFAQQAVKIRRIGFLSSIEVSHRAFAWVYRYRYGTKCIQHRLRVRKR